MRNLCVPRACLLAFALLTTVDAAFTQDAPPLIPPPPLVVQSAPAVAPPLNPVSVAPVAIPQPDPVAAQQPIPAPATFPPMVGLPPTAKTVSMPNINFAKMMESPEAFLNTILNAGKSPGFYQGIVAVAGVTDFLGDSSRYPLGYAGQGAVARPVVGQDTNLSYWRQDFSGAFPLYMPDGSQGLFATLGLRWINFDTKAVLPNTGQPFPENLYDVRPGLFYRQSFSNGWVLGFNGTVGSASDKPFNSYKEITTSVVSYLRMTRDNGDAWVASVTWLPMELSPYPIPGIAYNYITEDFEILIGVPFEMQWRIADNWSFEAGWLPVRRIRSQLTWQPDPQLAFFAGFDWTNENYQLVDRPERNDFLFAYEKRVSLGMRLRPGSRITLDLTAGYAFDRFFFQGQNYSDRNFDRINVDAGWFGMLRMGISF